MGILSWIVFGFLAGLLARAIMPGKQDMGIVLTTLLGIGGAFVGGLVGSALTGRGLAEFTPAGFIGAVVGALVLLLAAGFFMRRSGGGRRVAHPV